MSTDLLAVTELTPSERSFELQQALYRSKGIEVDVFGVPVAEADRADHGEVRIVPITDEILAAEAAAAAARQADREKLTWHRPEPLPASYYAARAKKKTRGRRAAAAKPPRVAKAATPIAPPPPAQVHKEEPPMEKHLEEKTCIVAGCNVALNANNKRGRCSEHGYLKKGTRLKDGTVTGEKPAAKKATAKKGISAAPPLTCQARFDRQDHRRHHRRRGRCAPPRSRAAAHRLLDAPRHRRQSPHHRSRAAERNVR